MELNYYLSLVDAGFFQKLNNITIEIEKYAKKSKDNESFKAFTEAIIILIILSDDMKERDASFIFILSQLNAASFQVSQANFVLHGKKIYAFVTAINDLVDVLFQVYMKEITGVKVHG